ncbi:uncharacterized protein LOC105389156 [Plutella xylostella]|uniref:uncharacterized protein LOC105389156 n=1 Tax=Plutella xylostella TaxID=51655 RepID=UPI002032BF4D|nr:uncharacterized protein LOC105389156 [Plutella xylostella]
MRKATIILLTAVFTIVVAEGQFYVPRAYYTIDAEGHASLPVPLRRLRRAASFYPQPLPAVDPADDAHTANEGTGSVRAVSGRGRRHYPALPLAGHGSFRY